MSFEAALIGAAIHMLFWEKLPEWGTWFNRMIAALPAPLRTLYAQWRCPYCAGFWIALCLHGATGLSTLAALDTLPAFWGRLGAPLGWFPRRAGHRRADPGRRARRQRDPPAGDADGDAEEGVDGLPRQVNGRSATGQSPRHRRHARLPAR